MKVMLKNRLVNAIPDSASRNVVNPDGPNLPAHAISQSTMAERRLTSV